jgi:hypothetical protein
LIHDLPLKFRVPTLSGGAFAGGLDLDLHEETAELAAASPGKPEPPRGRPMLVRAASISLSPKQGTRAWSSIVSRC